MKNTRNLYREGMDYLLESIRQSNEVKPSEAQLRTVAAAWLKGQDYLVPQVEWQQFCESLVHGVLGFGPLEIWLKDPTVSEIMVNGHDQVFVEKSGKLSLTSQRFASNQQLIQIINRMVAQVGRRIDESQPLVDARLPDGSRVNAIIPPLSLTGPVLTIRKFPIKPFTLKDMLKHGSVSVLVAELLQILVEQQQNILISGGTGAGKTSTLNACASLIPTSERVITIEDSAEIRINHPHLVSLESRTSNLEGTGAITIRDLLKNALRMRPDRIVVGEIRGGEAIDMLQAMNTGHQGSITTVHANAPLESLYRLETMVLMGDVELPLSAIRPQIKQGINWVLQQARLKDGSRKIIEIAEVTSNVREPDYEVKTLVRFDVSTQQFESGGYVPEIIQNYGSDMLQQWCKKS